MAPNQMNFNNMHLTPQSRSVSIERNQNALAEPSQPPSIPGSYGHYATQPGQPQGTYQSVSNDPGWTQRVLEEMKDLLLLLNAQGRITYASPSCKSVTGRAAKQLEGSLFTQYIHEDDKAIFRAPGTNPRKHTFSIRQSHCPTRSLRWNQCPNPRPSNPHTQKPKKMPKAEASNHMVIGPGWDQRYHQPQLLTVTPRAR